jgi:hypothetical protein
MTPQSTADDEIRWTRVRARLPIEVPETGTAQIAVWLSVPEGVGSDILQVLLHGAAHTQFPATENDTSVTMERAKVSAAVNYKFAPVATNMGHNLNQHSGAHDLYRTIADWITATLPSPTG